MSERSELVRDYRARVAHGWFDLRALLRDRRLILEKPERMLRPSAELAFSPTRFGFLIWVGLPTTLLAAVLATVSGLYPPPDSLATQQLAAFGSVRAELATRLGPIEAVQLPKEAQEVREAIKPALDAVRGISRAMAPDTIVDGREAFTRALDALVPRRAEPGFAAGARGIDHSLTHRELEARVGKRLEDSGLLHAFTTGMMGLAVLLNVWVFCWLVRRKPEGMPYAEQADRVMLYYLPARQLWLLATIVVIGLAANLALRYQDMRLFWILFATNGALQLAAFVHYFWCAWTMTAVLAGGPPERRIVRRVQRRILGSFAIILVAAALVGILVGLVWSFALGEWVHLKYGRF